MKKYREVKSVKSMLGSISVVDDYIYRNRCKLEAKRILSGLIDDKTCAVDVVYDHLSSPATLGDFIEVVMFARWFAARGNVVRFIVIGGEHRSDMSVPEDRISRELTLAREVLERFPNSSIAENTWESYSCSEIVRSSVVTVTPFIDRVLLRQDIYTRVMGVLNELHLLEPHVATSWLFASFDFPFSDIKLRSLKSNYLAWNVRFNPNRDIERNTSDDDFLFTLGTLRLQFPNMKIVLISDDVGCEHFRALAGPAAIDLQFATDFGRSFEEHAAIVLNAARYFQFGGGGMGEVAIYSRNDYTMYYTLSKPRRMWRKDRICSWQTSSQLFRQISISDTARLTLV